MKFFRQLGNKFGHFFGRQLPRGLQKFGRQLSTTGNTLGSAFDQGKSIYSKLEKTSNAMGVPIAPQVFGILGNTAGALANTSRGVGALGQGASQLASGDYKGAYSSGRQGYGDLKGAVNQGGDIVATGLPLLATLM